MYARESTLTGGVDIISVWVDLPEYNKQEGLKIWVRWKDEEKSLGVDWQSPIEEENASIEVEMDALFVKMINEVMTNRSKKNSRGTRFP